MSKSCLQLLSTGKYTYAPYLVGVRQARAHEASHGTEHAQLVGVEGGQRPAGGRRPASVPRHEVGVVNEGGRCRQVVGGKEGKTLDGLQGFVVTAHSIDKELRRLVEKATIKS